MRGNPATDVRFIRDDQAGNQIPKVAKVAKVAPQRATLQPRNFDIIADRCELL